ncbi:hypothetical protein HG536_0H02780 [Torulaspora globosa]|uniref:Sphingoid long-chain base transporter RSB1 n=1 Tax=Torulaspora globosa TaxID=48254 RepID=A0A7G3ZN17_9SACH|nr:uncharacterized protein HG536_0H02780 [Torulaspora globosa]QLL34903.1 hypothetical protein HG536_0H02780 [Torulaspora globosa]
MDIATLLEVSKRDSVVVDGRSPVSLYSGMVPNLAFNVAMLAIWGVLLSWHTLMIWYRQYWFSSAFVCAAILEVLGYVGRVWSHFDVYLVNPFLMQLVCLTIAPVFTMGGVYYQLAKMIEIYGHRFSLLPSPMAYSYIFIAFDFISLVVQAAGGGVAGTESTNGDSSDTGDNIFIAGLSLQVASMIIFMVLMGHLYYKVFVQTRLDHSGQTKLSLGLLKISRTEIDYLYRQKFSDLRVRPDRWVFHYFPLAMVVAVATVFVRCCYRLAELAAGWNGYLIIHENYFIILDALMIALATVALSVFHPGFAFQGRHVSIPITHGRVDPETVEKPPFEPEKEDSYIDSGEQVSGRGNVFMKPFQKMKNAFS